MLFVIDVGNTNTVMGIFHNDRLFSDWRIRTEKNITEDEFFILVDNLFKRNGIRFEDIEKTVISSVVPPMMRSLDSFCRKYLGKTPHWVDPRNQTYMPVRYANPAEVGADRIVNAVGAYALYKCALIVIDFGTATTFDAISEKGEYLGGAISPGIIIASEALFQAASKLPRVEIFSPPPNTIGNDTIESIQSGIIYGYAGLVDGVVTRMKDEIGPVVRVIATGGLAGMIKKVSAVIEAVEPSLTLEGLKIISDATGS